MKKIGRVFKIIIAHIWNSVIITLVAVIGAIPCAVCGGFKCVWGLWTEVIPDICARQNKEYAIYLKTGKRDYSIWEES